MNKQLKKENKNIQQCVLDKAEISKTSDLKFLLKVEILADDKVKSI